jgi:hypothetical protein
MTGKGSARMNPIFLIFVDTTEKFANFSFNYKYYCDIVFSVSSVFQEDK